MNAEEMKIRTKRFASHRKSHITNRTLINYEQRKNRAINIR